MKGCADDALLQLHPLSKKGASFEDHLSRTARGNTRYFGALGTSKPWSNLAREFSACSWEVC